MSTDERNEAALFQAFTASDYGLSIFLKQAIAISDAMLAKSTDAESKVAWLEMSIAAENLTWRRVKGWSRRTIGLAHNVIEKIY